MRGERRSYGLKRIQRLILLLDPESSKPSVKKTPKPCIHGCSGPATWEAETERTVV
jgi:hypothetical protein